jgi:hypothetical protein
MNHLKSYRIFENIDNPIGIERFLNEIGFPDNFKSQVITWWNQNRRDIKIHHFNFSSPKPIAGVFLGVDEIAINKRLPMPPHIKLFLALHESGHCNQHREGRFMAGYYDTVVTGDKPSFLRSYMELEVDANDFAFNSLREMGLERLYQNEEPRLRGNQGAGEMVWRMMTEDIERFRPVDFIDLLKKQIL